MITIKEQIINLRQENPRIPAIEIARQIGRSRERVRQLLVELELPTRVLPEVLPLVKLCDSCSRQLYYENQSGLCRKCFNQKHRITIICEICGKTKEIQLSQFKVSQKKRQKYYFCSRYCWGIWVGRNYGFARIYNYERICELRRLGFSYNQISQETGAHKRHINAILTKSGLTKKKSQ